MEEKVNERGRRRRVTETEEGERPDDSFYFHQSAKVCVVESHRKTEANDVFPPPTDSLNICC